jgi:uncharacterized membrane protein HdeD (DUF308 family)
MLAGVAAISTDEIRRHGGRFLALGIILVLLGVIALAFDFWTTIVSVLVFGWLFLIGGVIEIIHGFQTHRWGGFFLHLIAGLLAIIAGLLFILYPLAGALSLTLVLGALFLVGGIFRIVAAARLQFPHWGWAVAGGVITALLGLLLWLQWPASGLWFIGLAIGIDMIFRGWTWIMLSIAARHAPVLGTPRTA